MKRIFSVLIILSMLLSIVPFTVSAEAEIYMQSDFSNDGTVEEDFYAGNFTAQNEMLVGYADALALQSKLGWYAYDTSVEVAFGEDSDYTDSDRSFSMIYNDIIPQSKGLYDESYFINFTYDIVNKQLVLAGGGIANGADDILAGPVPFEMEADGSEFYTMGMSVTDGRIRCFVDGEMIFDYIDEEDKYFIGDSLGPEQEDLPVMLWWNTGNCLMINDIKVASPEGLYPFPVPVNYGDANGDGDTNLADVTLMLKHIAKWDNLTIDLAASDVNRDEDVNLSDVTHLLRAIANWVSIRLGHNDTVEIVEKATCKAPGKITLTCTVCGDSVTVETSIVPCKFEREVIKEVTCTENGEVKYTCSMCGESYTEEITCLGYHDYESTITKEGNCQEPMEVTMDCKNCDDVVIYYMEILGGHKLVTSEDGTKGKCKYCDYEVSYVKH